jgi:hypothetical protein
MHVGPRRSTKPPEYGPIVQFILLHDISPKKFRKSIMIDHALANPVCCASTQKLATRLQGYGDRVWD